MTKAKVIIADLDLNYTTKLQYKFIREFLNKIDLEIITERSYFEEFFSKSQSADVLIISDKLYTPQIRLHDIKNIFLMQEEDEDSEISDLYITNIYKYSDLRDIFNKIIGKSRGSLNISDLESKDTQIITVTSAVGGIGKTTIAMGLANSLANDYKKVLFIEASRLQTFQYKLKDKSVIDNHKFYLDLLNPKIDVYKSIKNFIRTENFSYIPAFKASLLTLKIDYSIYEKIAIMAKESRDYDYIIIDTETIFDIYKTRMLNLADKVLIITADEEYVVSATNNFMNNIDCVNQEKYEFIKNKGNNGEILSLDEIGKIKKIICL